MRRSNGTKGKTWVVQQLQCAYCGKPYAVSNLTRHAAACWNNPDYKLHLQASITPDMSVADYGRVSSSLKCPTSARIRADFGSWQNFIEWLFDVDDVIDVIGEELHMNRAELRKVWDGVPVFDTPRMTWTVDGHVLHAWGVR